MIEFLNKYGLVSVILITILLAAMLRYSGENKFKPDAYKHALPSLEKRNIIGPGDIDKFAQEKLLISLDGSDDNHFKSTPHILVPPDSIISRRYLKVIKNNKGPVILLSRDVSVSARAWMLLAQKGFDDIYIFSETDDEVAKNKFRPDSTIRPEY